MNARTSTWSGEKLDGIGVDSVLHAGCNVASNIVGECFSSLSIIGITIVSICPSVNTNFGEGITLGNVALHLAKVVQTLPKGLHVSQFCMALYPIATCKSEQQDVTYLATIGIFNHNFSATLGNSDTHCSKSQSFNLNIKMH